MKTVFANTTLFAITLRAWGNRKKVDGARVNTTAQHNTYQLTKKLVMMEELNDITRHQTATKDWCKEMSMPFFIKEGIFVVKVELVSAFEQKLQEASTHLHEVLVPRLLAKYGTAIEEARTKLGDLFDSGDYPSPQQLANSFDIEWDWLQIAVPDNIPAEVRAKEVKKFEESLERARQEITSALYTGFSELIQTGIERLSAQGTRSNPLRVKPFLEWYDQFMRSFHAKNLFNDAQIAALVEKAKGVLQDVSTQRIESSARFRQQAVQHFTAIQDELKKLCASRKIDLTEE